MRCKVPAPTSQFTLAHPLAHPPNHPPRVHAAIGEQTDEVQGAGGGVGRNVLPSIQLKYFACRDKEQGMADWGRG